MKIPAGGAYNEYLSGFDLQEIYGGETMNYTKGEWKVTKWTGHNDIHVSVNEGSYMRFVCNCGNPLADSLPTNPDAEANANLIAASPHMVELILKVVRQNYVFFPEDREEAKTILFSIS